MDFFLVPCAVGTYYDQSNKTCHACPQGSYQSETGQLQCLRCPNIAGRIGVTSGSGARSAGDCKGMYEYFEKMNYLNRLRIMEFSDLNVFLQNVVHLANSWTRKVACVVHAVTVSISQMRAHSPACCAALVKQRDHLKQHHGKNVAMSVHLASNWELMLVVNHAHVAHTDRKVFNRLVHRAHWDEPLQKLVQHQSKNVHCQCVNRVHT